VPATPRKLVIATRESALALWQAEHVRDRLQAAHPGLEVSLLGMTTEGDRRLGTTLARIGGKGLFVKELEEALMDGRADLAVHSMKDVPVNLPDGFVIAAVSRREDPRDAFVSNHHVDIDSLPPGARVGTSSLRRESQLRARRPDLDVKPVRGNVQTRLRKLDEGEFDAILLAAAGLKRLGLAERIRSLLDPAASLPAVGQGALGIECRADRADVIEAVSVLADAETWWCVRAERAMSRALAGNCTAPLGGYATIEHGVATLSGFVALPDGSRIERAAGQARTDELDAEALGARVAQRLTEAGALDVLALAEGMA
jgi:hydroxymethylbilane synthase